MRRFSNCLLLGLSLCVDSFGQVKNSTVAGVVSDEHSREVIRGAAVSVVGNQTNPTTTDDDGVFVMMVPQGVDSFRIRIEKSGYRIYEKLNKEASDKLRVEREMDNNPNVTEAERERKVTGDQNAMNFPPQFHKCCAHAGCPSHSRTLRMTGRCVGREPRGMKIIRGSGTP